MYLSEAKYYLYVGANNRNSSRYFFPRKLAHMLCADVIAVCRRSWRKQLIFALHWECVVCVCVVCTTVVRTIKSHRFQNRAKCLNRSDCETPMFNLRQMFVAWPQIEWAQQMAMHKITVEINPYSASNYEETGSILQVEWCMQNIRNVSVHIFCWLPRRKCHAIATHQKGNIILSHFCILQTHIRQIFYFDILFDFVCGVCPSQWPQRLSLHSVCGSRFVIRWTRAKNYDLFLFWSVFIWIVCLVHFHHHMNR